MKELGALNSATRTGTRRPRRSSGSSRRSRSGTSSRGISSRARFGLDTADQARLYAMVNLAAADGAISCWNDKYYWYFWRPRAAIREADTDGNPATVADPTWESLFARRRETTPPLGTPPFPDHPSGHGCVTGAVSTRCGTSSAGTRSSSTSCRAGHSTACRSRSVTSSGSRTRSRRSSTHGCGAGSTSVPPTCRARDRHPGRAVDAEPLLRADALRRGLRRDGPPRPSRWSRGAPSTRPVSGRRRSASRR